MAKKKPIIPPGGFAGAAQQTPAVQTLMSRAISKSKPRKKRKKVAKKQPAKRRAAKKKTRARSKAKKKPARMVKGSTAAKRHMAKLRKMRKK